ncbi:hypothetical protein BCR36DRAFT_415051, partial [Piromyces finnis]
MRNKNKNVISLSDKKHGVNKPSSYNQKPFPFQKPGFPIEFIKSTLGFSQKQDYKQRFHEKNSNYNSRTIDVCDENINELKENVKKFGNPEKYIISKISSRKKNDVTESVIDALILVIERIWPDECTLDANSGTKNIFENTSLRMYITYILYQSKVSLFIVYCSLIYLIKVGTEARKRIKNGNLIQKKSRIISNLSELKEEEFESLRKNNVKIPSYMFRNYINEQQLENQVGDYNSSSSSSSNSNSINKISSSVIDNESNINQEMMTIDSAIRKYHLYDSSINQKKSLFSSLSSFIPQFSGYEDLQCFKVPSNSLNYPKRMVNSLKNKYSDLENKMYSKMMTSLSKAYKLKEVASSSNPMNFLLGSLDDNINTSSKNNETKNNSDEESFHDNYDETENDDDDDYDYETDTENYYCNNIARKSLSAASSIKSLSTSLSSSIIDNISYLKQSFDGSGGEKRSRSKTQSSKNSSKSSYDENNFYSKQSYEHNIINNLDNSNSIQQTYNFTKTTDNNRRNNDCSFSSNDNHEINKFSSLSYESNTKDINISKSLTNNSNKINIIDKKILKKLKNEQYNRLSKSISNLIQYNKSNNKNNKHNNRNKHSHNYNNTNTNTNTNSNHNNNKNNNSNEKNELNDFNEFNEDFEFNNSSKLLPFSGRHAILACLILCSKFYYDNDVLMIKNKFWQTFCGLSNNSLNYIQSKILDLLNYNLVIEVDRFSRFAGVMLTYTNLKNKVYFSQPYLTYKRRSIHLDILLTIALSESEQLQSSLVKSVNKFKKHIKDWQNYLN